MNKQTYVHCTGKNKIKIKHSFWLSEELGYCTVNNNYKKGVFEHKFAKYH